MRFLGGKVGVIVAVANTNRSVSIVRLGDDDYGLYIGRYGNDFHTPLAARGTEKELRDFVHQHRHP